MRVRIIIFSLILVSVWFKSLPINNPSGFGIVTMAESRSNSVSESSVDSTDNQPILTRAAAARLKQKQLNKIKIDEKRFH